MITSPLFKGDNDEEVQWQQRSVYRNALRTIVSECNRHARFARAILPPAIRAVLHDSQHADWGKAEKFDPRTLQNAHDLLAAAWRFRFRFDLRQLKLRLEHPDTPIDTLKPQIHWVVDPLSPQLHWLWWLARETETWIDEPWFIRLVLLILSNQNEAVEYQAEYELRISIINKFPDVPWCDKLLEI